MAEGRPRVPSVGFFPEAPGFGSWEWVGTDIAGELGKWYRTQTCRPDEVAECDVLFVIKHPPDPSWSATLPPLARVVFCPIDYYGGASEIDADAWWFRRCSRILVHCESLRKYFAPYAPVEYMDHHIKYVGLQPAAYRTEGPILWAGVRSNLSPLVEWANEHPLPGELVILTNPERPGPALDPGAFGFRRGLRVRMEAWSPGRHRDMLAVARGAIDIKGGDFRQSHKPPTKALDFIAAGLPLALEPNSGGARHLARLGFEAAAPQDAERWLSRPYWEETRRFGAALREILSLERIGLRFKRVVEEVLGEGRGGPRP